MDFQEISDSEANQYQQILMKGKMSFVEYYEPGLLEAIKNDFQFLDSERTNWLLSIERHAQKSDWNSAAQIAIGIFEYLEARGFWQRIEHIWKDLLSKSHSSSSSYYLKSSLLRQLGRIFSSQGKHSEAIQNLELGLDLARQSNSRELEIKLLYEFGAEFVDRGQHKNAKQYLSRAFDIAQEIGERKDAQFIKGQLANVLVAEGRLDEAVDILHRILNKWQDFEHETDRMLAHTTLHALGRVFLRQGRYLEAQRVLSESMQLKMHLDSGKGLVARTRCLLAEAYMGLDSISEAESHLIESIQASKDVGDSRYVALGYKNMAHLQCKLRNYQNAEVNLALATSFAQQSQNPNIIFNIALMRIKTGILSGRLRSAYRGFVTMTQVLDDIKFSPLATSRVFLNRLKYL